MNLKGLKAVSAILTGVGLLVSLFDSIVGDKVQEAETREIVRDEMKKIAEESDDEEES